MRILIAQTSFLGDVVLSTHACMRELSHVDVCRAVTELLARIFSTHARVAAHP